MSDTQTLGEESIKPNADPQYATVAVGTIPDLGALVKVVASAGIILRKDGGGYYSETESSEVTVTPHIYQLLADGDLVVVLPPTT